MRSRNLLVLACALALASGNVAAQRGSALPEPVVQAVPDLRLAGEGRLRRFGFHIYDASLWVRGEAWDPDREYALDIRYVRRVSRDQLVETSVDEMRRMGMADSATLERWRAELVRVLPGVGRGDRITGVHHPGRGAAFYLNSQLVGEVRDPAFARAFFSIWLDERTRDRGLRHALLGAS